MKAERPPKQIVGLQYLRGLAAVAVVLNHASVTAAFPHYFGREILGGLLVSGAYGVDLFFVMSGFIITVTALKGTALTAAHTPAQFIEKRFIRIVPLMWIAVGAYLLAEVLWHSDVNYLSSFRAFFLLPGDVAPVQIWTLRNEVVFYVVFCLSFLMRKQQVWFFFLWVAAGIVLAPLFPLQSDAVLTQFTQIVVSTINIEFAAGALIGFVWHKRTRSFAFDAPVPPVLVCIFAVAALMASGFALNLTTDYVWMALLLAIICGGILCFSVHVRCPEGRISDAAKLIGDASYSIYLFHTFAIGASLMAWSHFAPNTPLVIVLAITIVAAIFFGIVVHLLIEKPLIRLLRTGLGIDPKSGTTSRLEWYRHR